MATHNLGNAQGFTDKSKAVAGPVSSGSVGSPVNYDSQSDLDARLTTLGYTEKQLDGMTMNDKVYAVRLNDDADTI